MKKNIIPPILAVIIALSLCGCGKKESEKPDHTTTVETEVTSEAESSEEKEETQPETAEQPETTETTEETFSFAELAALQFCFSSGAGGWATMLTINEDGSFSGEYHDGEMGLVSDDYPKGTVYRCDFSGQFTQPVKVNEYTYSIQIREMNYEEVAGKEEIIDGVLFCYSDVYGLEGAENILIYLPGAPLAELPEEFRGWVGYYDLSDTTDTELPFYALNNEAQQLGFSSYDIIESLKEVMTYTEDRAAFLENSIENDLLTLKRYLTP